MVAPVYLVRHGQSEWNVLRLTQGQTSHPRLTEVGHAQAMRAAELISRDLSRLGQAVGRLLTSDLRRAMETAEIVGRHLQVSVESDQRLREQRLGVLEGRTYEETWAAADALDWSDPDAAVEGGESMGAVRRRMAAVVSGLKRDRVHVLVSHGDAIRAALAHLHGHEPHDVPWVDVPNGAVARFDDAVTWLT